MFSEPFTGRCYLLLERRLILLKYLTQKCFPTVRVFSEEQQHLTISFIKLCQTSSYNKYYGTKYYFTILVFFGFTL